MRAIYATRLIFAHRRCRCQDCRDDAALAAAAITPRRYAMARQIRRIDAADTWHVDAQATIAALRYAVVVTRVLYVAARLLLH